MNKEYFEPGDVQFDEYGEEFVLDANGNRQPPMQTTKCSRSESGFLSYDSPLHCGLCGRMDCRGNCFK